MAHLLQPFTNVMLASPQNLHLSHMDSDKLSLLETNPNILGLDLAHSMAESTFNRLTSFLQTTVTLTVYDLQKSENYLTELYSKYESYLSSITSKTTNDDNIDCKELSLFGSLSDSTVVKNWYRPSPFERRADSHSGWGCKQ